MESNLKQLSREAPTISKWDSPIRQALMTSKFCTVNDGSILSSFWRTTCQSKCLEATPKWWRECESIRSRSKSRNWMRRRKLLVRDMARSGSIRWSRLAFWAGIRRIRSMARRDSSWVLRCPLHRQGKPQIPCCIFSFLIISWYFRSGRIGISEGDDLRRLAQNFCKAYSLNKDMEESLVK